MGSYQTVFIPSKTATLVPEFAVEDLPQAEHSDDDDDDDDDNDIIDP